MTNVLIDEQVLDGEGSGAGEARWRRRQEPDLLIVDAVVHVLEGRHRRVVDEIGVVDRQQYGTEVAHGQQESVEGRAQGAEVSFPFAIDEVENLFNLFDDLLVGVAQRCDTFDDSQQGAKRRAALQVPAARAKYEATRAFGRQAGCVEQRGPSHSPATLD